MLHRMVLPWITKSIQIMWTFDMTDDLRRSMTDEILISALKREAADYNLVLNNC